MKDYKMARTFGINGNPKIIKWARESAGFSEDEIAKKLKTRTGNYKKIEKLLLNRLRYYRIFLKDPLQFFSSQSHRKSCQFLHLLESCPRAKENYPKKYLQIYRQKYKNLFMIAEL